MSSEPETLYVGLRRYDELAAEKPNAPQRPSVAVKMLGIEYERSEVVAIGDCMLFYGCTNVPADLPAWIRRVDWLAKN